MVRVRCCCSPAPGRARPAPHAPDRPSARERASAAVRDPRGHVQRARGRRAAVAARRPARRRTGARRDRRDVSRGLRADAARTRRLFGRTDAYTVYDQADVRKVIEWLLSDAQRGAIQAALTDSGQPASAELLGRDLAGQEPTALPRHLRAQLAQAARSSRPCGVSSRSSCGARTRSTSTTCSCTRCGCCAEHPHRLAHYRQRWRWLLVDEFQDTNEAQTALVALLAGAGAT